MKFEWETIDTCTLTSVFQDGTEATMMRKKKSQKTTNGLMSQLQRGFSNMVSGW